MDKERFTPFVLYIERISKNIKRIADEKMAPYSLRSAHVMCIMQLGKNTEGLSSSELSEACGVDKAFISRITSELIEKGYIAKEDGSEGKYKIKFYLTEKGEEINQIIVQIVMECLEKVDSHISLKKLEIFYELLAGIDKGVEALVKKEK
ncbi:MAG: MarR family transcriptional regulator [Clostridia bacterium]|nr:MarR family transcriptional regulator [Clostridia bacterium]